MDDISGSRMIPTRLSSRRKRAASPDLRLSILVDPLLNEEGPESKRRRIVEIESRNLTQTAKMDKVEDNRSTEPKELSEDEPEDLSEVEKIRLKNMEENAKFLSSLGICKVIESVRPKAMPKTSVKRFKAEKKPLQIRKSLRLQNLSVSSSTETTGMSDAGRNFQVQPERVRLLGTLSFEEQLQSNISTEEAAALISQVGCLTKNYTMASNVTKTKKSIQGDFKKMKLTVERVVKVTPGRICSLAVHPTLEKVIVCAGDKYGNIGFLDVEKGSEGSVCYAPHARHVSHLLFHPQQPSRLLSASGDGTLRCADLEAAVFDEVYTTAEDDELRLMFFDMVSPSSLLVSRDDGCVAVVDTRMKRGVAAVHKVHQNRVKSVSVHPIQKHHFLTGSNDSVVSLWDLRKLSGKRPSSLVSFPLSRSVDSAYFSPVTGNRFVTTSLDGKLRIYDSADLTNVSQKASVRHDNNTGRWLSNFRATWHPQADDLFVVGSMSRPRQIEVFDENANIVKVFRDENLASVCSLNIFHPTSNVLIGGNSSGRLHVFSD